MISSLRRHAPIPLTVVLAALLAGCVMIPYRPSAETTHDRAEIADRENLRLSVGPRNFLDEMAKAVAKADQRVQPVDGQTFIDTASPTGDLTLARLQDSATLDLTKPLQLDFVVLFAEPVEKEDDQKGGFFPFFGLGMSTKSATYWTAVLDAQTLKLVEQLNSKSTGTSAGALWGIYGLFVEADAKGSARKDVVRHVVETMAATRPTGALRVAFLAVEPIATPEQGAVEAQEGDPGGPRWTGEPQWASGQYPTFVTAAPPPEGQALVYLYRPDTSNQLLYLTMDFETGATAPGVVVSRLYQGGYYPIYVPGGELTLRAQYWTSAKKQPASVTLRVEPGTINYVRAGTRRSFWRGDSPTLSLIDADKATVELANCRLMPSAREHDIEAERRAELGDVLAQYYVMGLKQTGVTYADGPSLPPDYPAAYKWILITKMSTGREELAAKLTPEQIAEAERQAAEWRARATGTDPE